MRKPHWGWLWSEPKLFTLFQTCKMKSFSTQMDLKQRGFMPNLMKLNFGYSNYTCEAFERLWEGDKSKCPLASHWCVSTYVMLGAHSFVLITLAPQTKRLVWYVGFHTPWITSVIFEGRLDRSRTLPVSQVVAWQLILSYCHTQGADRTLKVALSVVLLYTNKRKAMLGKVLQCT